jgi:hypothetical protein
VIVRIVTEGQYDVPDNLYDELNKLDNRAVEAVEAGDEELFYDTWNAMLGLVRDRGSQLEPEDLRESSLILPPPDLTLAEAEHEFTGEGLLPD